MIFKKTDIDYLIETVKLAGGAIMEVYREEDFGIEKKQDESPLTLADKRANHIITQRLETFGLPILSEEGKEIAYEERKNWAAYWCVDPLDGTKEFIKKNGEFTVNIAFIKENTPVWGIIYAPVLDCLYYIDENDKAVKQFREQLLPLPKKQKDYTALEKGVRVVASRSHMDEKTRQFIADLEAPEVVSMGSSLKFMLLAEGKADVYPRFSPTMEWDTAAAHAIIKNAGYNITTQDEALVYNKLALSNPLFIAC